jgi:two-component system OmpR family sensor kinase
MALKGNEAPAERPPDEPPTEHLQLRIRQLEAEVEAREQLLSIAAHELRNPIHAIGLQIGVAHQLAAARGDRALAERLEQVEKSLQWFLKRCSVMLDLSRTATGLKRLELGTVDLRDVLQNVALLYEPQSRLHGAPVHVECSGDVVGLWDAPALEQAVGNLVGNAIRFGAGSPVMVIAQQAGSAVVKIQITDRGAGIPPAEQELMLSDFPDVMHNSDFSKGGFGGGLWLARNLIEAHGGYLEVFTAPDSGSTFTIYLPKSSPAIDASSATPRFS